MEVRYSSVKYFLAMLIMIPIFWFIIVMLNEKDAPFFIKTMVSVSFVFILFLCAKLTLKCFNTYPAMLLNDVSMRIAINSPLSDSLPEYYDIPVQNIKEVRAYSQNIKTVLPWKKVYEKQVFIDFYIDELARYFVKESSMKGNSFHYDIIAKNIGGKVLRIVWESPRRAFTPGIDVFISHLRSRSITVNKKEQALESGAETDSFMLSIEKNIEKKGLLSAVDIARNSVNEKNSKGND